MLQVFPVVKHPNSSVSPYVTEYEAIGEPLSVAGLHETVTPPLLARRPSTATAVTFVGASGAVAET